ncbi:M14 family metallopeptidase [Rhodohalobacter sp. 8-1]|uniref:M14 family metallopeptidase n=1 Tax=Rhodohalobacter sp. 8-1 TaxID=3131972 RepID=UPI0030EE9EA3
MSKLKLLLSLFLVLIFNTPAASQLLNDRFTFDDDLQYAPDVQSPADFLGYQPGEAYSHHYQLGAYLEQLAESSDRVSLVTYGQTHEGRDLWLAIITSEENHSNLEEIREANLQIGDQSLSDAEASDLIQSSPAIVWLSYGVHGNEASSAEAALQTAYRMAAAEDDETSRFRDEAVIIIDPILNPDGRDRYVTWYKSSLAHMLNTDPVDLEHDEIWPGGRTNHYWFDLNRDWVWLVHPESRGRIAEYQKWMPQVHLDLHEQGFNNNYFTMPGTTPRNQQLPDEYEEWADVFGRGTIEEFDKHNINYATREAFDFFYPGYGSSYPSLMGGIGMLAEQGGHSRGGRAVETEDGYVLTLEQRIFDHYTNSVATVRTAVENRTELLDYYRDALNPENSKVDTEAYILPNNPNDLTYDVIDIMLKQGIEVEQASEEFTLRNATDYRENATERRSFNEGDFIIRKDQAKHLLVTTLFEPKMAFGDSVMYDMSVWSVPMAYNLDAYLVRDNPSVETTRIMELPQRESGVINASSEYAFAIDWEQQSAPKALAELWRRGYRVRSAEKEFTKDGRTFNRGTLIVLTGRNYEKRSEISRDMHEVAEHAGVLIYGMDTGRMDTGMDLASRSSKVLHQPKTAMIVDRPFNSYTAGQIWFQFDQNVGYGISRIRSWRLASIDLSEYDVIILPGMRGSSPQFGEDEQSALKLWVEQGGTLVATEDAALNMTADRMEFLAVELVEEKEEIEDDNDPAVFTPYEARQDTFGLRNIPGASFVSNIDTTHPLAFGVKEELYSLTYNTNQFAPSTSFQIVGRYEQDASDLLASGYASQENLQKAAGNVWAGVAALGDGKVVLLADNTQYRMFWRGPERLMINAVMLIPSM